MNWLSTFVKTFLRNVFYLQWKPLHRSLSIKLNGAFILLQYFVYFTIDLLDIYICFDLLVRKSVCLTTTISHFYISPPNQRQYKQKFLPTIARLKAKAINSLIIAYATFPFQFCYIRLWLVSNLTGPCPVPWTYRDMTNMLQCRSCKMF